MALINWQRLSEYRARTYFSAPGLQVTTVEGAIDFVNQRGFVFFWPIKGVELPSLWAAAAGNRPVADEHDDPGHVTWGWKDETLGKKVWYYGRVLKRRNAFISLETLPYFYALSPNYGEPQEDYLIEYQQGQLRPELKWVFEALLNEGPMDTLSLRKAAHLTNHESDGRFNRAVDDLQLDFRILPVGIAPVGAWKYAFIYDCTHRHYPDIFERVTTLDLTEPAARQHIAALYFRSIGAARPIDAVRLFNWRPPDTQKALAALVEQGLIVPASHPQLKEEYLSLPELLE